MWHNEARIIYLGFNDRWKFKGVCVEFFLRTLRLISQFTFSAWHRVHSIFDGDLILHSLCLYSFLPYVWLLKDCISFYRSFKIIHLRITYLPFVDNLIIHRLNTSGLITSVVLVCSFYCTCLIFASFIYRHFDLKTLFFDSINEIWNTLNEISFLKLKMEKLVHIRVWTLDIIDYYIIILGFNPNKYWYKFWFEFWFHFRLSF